MAATSKFWARESFDKLAPHHTSIQALWEGKWRAPCAMGIYPFPDGDIQDFDQVFKKLIEMNMREPYDPDTYAAAFFPVAEQLEAAASAAEAKQESVLASSLYLRAVALYRISRFPVIRSAKTFEAWERGKAAYSKGGKYLTPPNEEFSIPHTHASASDGNTIQAYVRIPEHASKSSPVPVVLFVCGLDAYRTDFTSRIDEHIRRGFAVVSVEIPGTGDSPASKQDPLSPDRQWPSVLDWIDSQDVFDPKKLCARSMSTGGYYGMRMAHTHADRLLAVVSQGGGCHRMFDKDWIKAQDKMEYPYALAEALAHKFGYDSVEAYSEDSQRRFSLLESGIFDNPCCRLFLINGTKDEIFPIEDSMIPFQHGRVKDVRFIEGAYHIGNPGAESYVYDWLDLFK
ncbi:hypothetical protein N7533_008438 [Penicillium manginii]|uniref:uncharacterized protein n=1 Tax=Penicillium manginii TaxID=203109 RepID=UPI002548171E|nr:uncharacterized protein N7533_008438 [Penicillium manginii]KAJ5743568.1 hypothetical protein N7533_008438 [Penicillium manginii]